MTRWTGSWLDGPSSAGAESGEESVPAGPPGVRLGLPPEGAGAIAPTGRRIGAFAIDAVGSGLISALFTHPQALDDASLSAQRAGSLLVLVVVYVFFSAFVGQTPGMYVMGLRLARLEDGGPLGLWRALVRTALLVMLVPALIWDADRRGMHDKAVNSVLVRSR